MTRSRTPHAETLACTVAAGYAVRWAGSVARGDHGADAPWVVDGFAGAELQRAALRGIAGPPSARALPRAAGVLERGARVLLVEEDPGLLARLEDELRDGGDRVRRVSHPADAVPGEVALLEAPFASVAARLAAEIGDVPALVRLAPLSARAVPAAVLRTMNDLTAADLLLRVPAEDFARVGAFGGPLADYPPHLRRVVDACSALLDDERHGWLLAWREAARAGGEEAALVGTVERLRALLSEGEGERTVHAVRVEGTAGGAVHLLLSTPDPGHARELDGAVMDGAASSPALAGRSRARVDAPSADPPPAGDAPAVPPAAAGPAPPSDPAEPSPPPTAPPAVETAGVEEAAPLDLFASPIELPAAPPVRGPSAPRPRKARKPLPGVLELFAEEEQPREPPAAAIGGAADADAPAPLPPAPAPAAKKPRRTKE